MAAPYSSTFVPLGRTGWTVTASDVTWGAVALAIDGSTGTQWNTTNTFPQWMVIDMQVPLTFDRITMLTRQDGFQDRPGSIEVYVSTDGLTWGSPVFAQSGLPNDNTLKTFGPFSGGAVTKRYLKYQVLSEASGARQFTSVAEINAGSVVSIYVIASNRIAPLTNAGKAAKHQPVRASSGARTTPSAVAPPVPVAADLKGGVTGTAYTETITAQRGTSPYTFAVTGGALPTGTTISSAGVITGTPSAAGTFSFTVTVTDANVNTGTQGFVIVIAAPAATGGGNYGYVS